MEKLRKDLKQTYTAAIEAVSPYTAIKNSLTLENNVLKLFNQNNAQEEYDLRTFEHIYIVGAGKATAAMAQAVEELLGDKISEGCICVKYGYTAKLSRITTIEAAHPIPDANGVLGAKQIIDLLNKTTGKDMVISLISGGGSALLPLPPDAITLAEKRATTDLLLKCGATIHEINAIRKHLSLIKGGNMARAAYPATVINLMISDVVGDNPDVIASGPFVADNSTFNNALNILESYDLVEKLPPPVLEYIKAGVAGSIQENPGPHDPIFDNITNFIIASNITALQAAKNTASQLGYNAIILSSMIEGDTTDAAFWHSRIAQEIIVSGNPAPVPACIISGGETTVRVTGNGRGGRNMEFALRSAHLISGIDNLLVASIGTDGSDGPTDSAGALVDGFTLNRAKEKNLDIQEHLRNNDSYHFFKELDDLIITGPTNTNVMDVRIVLIGPQY